MNAFTVKFRCPARDKVSSISPWFSLLDETLPSDFVLRNLSESPSDGEIWLAQVLELSLLLLQIKRVPIFDPIPITSCEPREQDSSYWEAKGELPDPKLVAPSTFKEILQISFALGFWISQADVEKTDDRNKIFAFIEERLGKVFPSNVGNGKSTIEILRAAYRMGIPFRILPAGIFQLGWGAKSRYIDRSTTDMDSVMGLSWTRNKLLGNKLLQQAGLPVPMHFKARSLNDAKQAAEILTYPVVVKPVDCERGEGVSVDVDALNLESALAKAVASSPSKTAIIESQEEGVCHRLFVASGQLLYAVKRQPIGVYGDGKNQIKKLVSAEYDKQLRRAPWVRTKIKPLDDVALGMLERQGLTPDSVPEAGRFVDLRRIESTELGGISKDVTDVVHPDNASLAIRAARLFRLDVAGVDIMSNDISIPWHVNGAKINEVNYSPLFGTSETSRNYLQKYISNLLNGEENIPLYYFEDDEDSKSKAFGCYDQLRSQGVSVFLSDDKSVRGPDGLFYPLAVKTLNGRVDALLCHQEVEAIVIIASKNDHQNWLIQRGINLSNTDD